MKQVPDDDTEKSEDGDISMPIDDELLETARTIHDEMMACGMVDEAAAIRYVVSSAIEDQQQEEEFGTERISACMDAISDLRRSFENLVGKKVTAGGVSSILRSSVPQISLMVEAENGPSWVHDMVAPINEAVRRLVAQLYAESPEKGLGPGGQIRLAECITSLGTVHAGENRTSSQR